jgi:hypothetical protein
MKGKFFRNYQINKDGSETIVDTLVDPVVNRPYVVGQAEFANGMKFTITREPGKGQKSGGFKVTRHNSNSPDDKSYAGTLPKAWASVRYMARIAQSTERSTLG